MEIVDRLLKNIQEFQDIVNPPRCCEIFKDVIKDDPKLKKMILEMKLKEYDFESKCEHNDGWTKKQYKKILKRKKNETKI